MIDHSRMFAAAVATSVALGLAACSGGSPASAPAVTPSAPATATATAPAPSTTPSPGVSPSSTPNAAATAGFPAGFWDASNVPPAKNVMTFKFLNRTNGVYPDSAVYWSVDIGGVTQTHSIAQQATFDMPANASGRIYVYLGTPGTNENDYYDFLEYTIGTSQFNGDTSRVDAFGIKLAFLLHDADGSNQMVGENAATFAEGRSATFARFITAVPSEFQSLAQVQAPYRIVNPGAGAFGAGGTQANYYTEYVNQVWSSNSLTIPTPGPNLSGLAAYPDLSAALNRHTAAGGTFASNGTLIDSTMWSNPATFYSAAPANYYAQFWHANAIDGKAYGFPYDDAGGYSSFVSHDDPQYALVAIGW
jgi:hypothetical protein